MRNFILFNIVVILASSFYLNEVILTEDVIHQSLESQLSNEQIESVMGISKQMAWLDYLLSVLGYFFRILIVSSLIYLILYLNEIEVSFADTVGLVAKSLTIFLVPMVIKITALSFSDTVSLDDIQFFSFGSLLDVFDTDGMENWLKVVLKSINIWEVLFIVMLSLQLKKYFDNDLKKSIYNVAISYGAGMLVWTFFVVFVTITISQE